MGLRSDGKQWLADNVCGPIQTSDPHCAAAVQLLLACPFAHARPLSPPPDGVRGALVYAEMRNMLTVLCIIVVRRASSSV